MFRYRLRTLLILMAIGPILGAFVYRQVERAIEARRQRPPGIVVEVVWGHYVEDLNSFLPAETVLGEIPESPEP
jgi:hypothetical protein